jgi:hypothetical protein
MGATSFLLPPTRIFFRSNLFYCLAHATHRPSCLAQSAQAVALFSALHAAAPQQEEVFVAEQEASAITATDAAQNKIFFTEGRLIASEPPLLKGQLITSPKKAR